MTHLFKSNVFASFFLLTCISLSAQGYQTSSSQSESESLRPTWVDAGTSLQERSFFDLGVSASYGRDTAVNNVSNLKSQFTNVQGRLGAGLRSRTTSMSLRHDATILQFPGSNISLQQ